MAWYYKNNICGKTDESLRRKATGPLKWQPVAENSRHCLFSSASFFRKSEEKSIWMILKNSQSNF